MPVVSSITPTQSDVQAALRAFLIDVLPTGVDVISALGNRVAEPAGTRYVVMTPVFFKRLATNWDSYDDVKFVGSIADTVLTVTEVDHGTLQLGRMVFGVSVAAGSQIIAQTSGTPGGVGTYQLSTSQTIGSQVLSAGAALLKQNAEVTVQLDVHSADLTAGDMAQTISTAFRDDLGTRFFAAQGKPISPLYADDPREMPFTNDQQQYEWRWVVDACLQVDQTLTVPMQFADTAVIGLIEVDSHYPP